jgi:hypothetical protein
MDGAGMRWGGAGGLRLWSVASQRAPKISTINPVGFQEIIHRKRHEIVIKLKNKVS